MPVQDKSKTARKTRSKKTSSIEQDPKGSPQEKSPKSSTKSSSLIAGFKVTKPSAMTPAELAKKVAKELKEAELLRQQQQKDHP